MTTVYRASDYFDEWNEGIYNKKILIEGDSWVSHYLLNNLAVQFDKATIRDGLILNLAVPGDNAGSRYDNSDAVFLAGGRQMKILKRVLKDTKRGAKFDLIFISAAGNDVIGPEIREIPLINNKRDFPGSYGRDLINLNFYGKMEKVISGYRHFLTMLGKTINKKTPVITHTYAYLKPRKKGTEFLGLKFNKGWIAQHLEHQGITDPDEQYEIVVAIFDRYFQHITSLQTEFKKQFLVVDTRRVLLKNGVPNTRWFKDEIHPTDAGFKKLFNVIRKKARSTDMWPLD